MSIRFKESFIKGVYKIDNHLFEDSRGSFLNIFRNKSDFFSCVWKERQIMQVNICRTSEIGSVRGLHLQSAPHAEAKLITCIRGSIWDVVVDLRVESSTYMKWDKVVLSSEHCNSIFIPEGCAHGYQVLENDSELIYLHSGNWVSEAETGVRWNDPQINVNWPLSQKNLSDRDKKLPFLKKNGYKM